MRHTAIFRTAMILALAALGASAATAQTDFSFAAGTDSTGWAQAQSNADGHVLIESPQYPHGLWLHLVDETGDALAGIQVEYQGRPDSLVAIRCVDPAESVRETLVWSRPEGDPLRLTLKPSESTDLPAGLTAIDWQIDPTTEVLLVPEQETRLEGWEAVAAFLRERWQGQTGRVAVQLDASTSFAVELDRLEVVETLVDRLKQIYQSAGTPLGDSAAVDVQVFGGGFALQEGVIFYLPLFADANLESVVRQVLGRPQGRLTLEDVASLTSIQANSLSISSLVGLENCTALQSLSMFDNQITEVTPLANLTNLEWLFLSRNQITEVEPLADLNKLEMLGLFGNQITEVTPLASLNNLEVLDLVSNQITEVGPLANLTNLHTLNLHFNQIAEVGPLASLTNLVQLGLSSNQIAEVGPLASLTNLYYLSLSHNQITEVRPLASLNNLHTLGLRGNQIAELGPLAMASLNNLHTLDLRDNQIAELGPLAMASLTSLERLSLSHNQIAEIEPLASLTNLYYLSLSHNQITEVTPLLGLTKLSSLSIGSNQIEDLAPLVANPGLSEGDRVYLTDNPLSDQALNEQIPALQARGVNVKY